MDENFAFNIHKVLVRASTSNCNCGANERTLKKTTLQIDMQNER